MGLGNAIIRGFTTAVLAVAGLSLSPARAQTPTVGDSVSSITQLTANDASIENPATPPGKSVLAATDETFLDDLESRGVQFFVDSADPVTGLMPDRAHANGSGAGDIASVASVGFGMTALCIGDYRGWVPHQRALDICTRVLTFLRDKGLQQHGYFYHFINMHTGARVWNCEVSDVDTAILMAGVITVRQHFAGTDLAKLADELYNRVEWPWMMSPDGTLYMGWHPPGDKTSGFYSNWNNFDEGPLLYLMGLGSQTHPLASQSWRAWKREPVITYDGLTYLQCEPLFTHQYPQCWFDLRGLRDDHADYFRNSQLATIAQRQWTIDELSHRFSDYGANMWGLTASDTETGYDGWGGPPIWPKEYKYDKLRGTVTAAAAAGSLAFEPRLCLDDLENMRSTYGDKAFLKYGFVDAFSPLDNWYDTDCLGIDIGPSVIMAENCRSGFVWQTFMSSPEAKAALKAAGFRALEPSDDRPTSSLFTGNQTAGTGG
jgi:hypothetical protein